MNMKDIVKKLKQTKTDYGWHCCEDCGNTNFKSLSYTDDRGEEQVHCFCSECGNGW